MKINRWQLRNDNGDVIESEDYISVKQAKALLKEKGGYAWSEQYKGGDFIGMQSITLSNNAKVRKSQDASRKDVGQRMVAEANNSKAQLIDLFKKFETIDGNLLVKGYGLDSDNSDLFQEMFKANEYDYEKTIKEFKAMFDAVKREHVFISNERRYDRYHSIVFEFKGTHFLLKDCISTGGDNESYYYFDENDLVELDNDSLELIEKWCNFLTQNYK